MTKGSKQLGIRALVEYHYEAISAPSEANYYQEGGRVQGNWHGKLAEHFGLMDKPVDLERITRLANGQHPGTGEQLVKHRAPAQRQVWETTNAAWVERVKTTLANAYLERGVNIF